MVEVFRDSPTNSTNAFSFADGDNFYVNYPSNDYSSGKIRKFLVEIKDPVANEVVARKVVEDGYTSYFGYYIVNTTKSCKIKVTVNRAAALPPSINDLYLMSPA